MSGTTGFRFGDFEADLAEGVLRRGGFRVRLQDLPFRLLVALAERPGQLVTREELQKVLWPTETYGDFGHRLGGALNRLREAIGDPADRPRVIETVPRRGYRFRAPVERIAAPDRPPAIVAPERPPAIVAFERPTEPLVPAPTSRRRPRLALAAGVLLAVTAGAWRVVPASVEGDERAGIAVLPFTDLSGTEPGLCDGLTEEVITSLSRQPLPVIGRTSAMAYRGSGKRIDEIGRELGVPFVVEGSVRRAGPRLRVTVRLLDARPQTPLWSESFEGEAADPLALQARVALEVAQAVRPHATTR
jgi:TolB-like protein/DNA-binding winged helix-turn-helix (wHTH) protein